MERLHFTLYICSRNCSHEYTTSKMKLTEQAIQLLEGTERKAKALRTMLALQLNFTERWIQKCIHENKDNGPLTTLAALKVLKQETGLTEEQLFAEPEKAIA